MGNLGTIIDGRGGEVNEQPLKTDAERGDAETRGRGGGGSEKKARRKGDAVARHSSGFLQIDFY
jgi:hypothetical protein